MIVLTALAPIFGLITLGYLFRRFVLTSQQLWRQAERITYFILFPALLISKLALNDTTATTLSSIAATVFPMLALGSLALFLLKSWMRFTDQEFPSVYQGGIRFNSYVGLAVVQQVFGEESLTVAAVLIAFLIPTINVLCVSVLAIYSRSSRPSLRTTVGHIVRNPLILACLTGIGLNASGAGLPFGTDRILIPLGRSAVIVGLVVVGAGLRPHLVLQAKKAVFSSTVFRLVFMPLLATGLVYMMNLNAFTGTIIVIFAGLPTHPQPSSSPGRWAVTPILWR